MFLEIASHNWWVFLIRGLAAILFGIVAWIWPELTVTTLVILFGAYALVDGVFATVTAIRNGGRGRWLPLALTGLAGIAIGILTFIWPDTTAVALLILVTSWAIVIGALQMLAAVQLRRYIEGEWVLGLGGLLSVVFGVILVLFPDEGAIALIWTIGIYAILFGALLVALAFLLRSARDNVRV